MIVTAKTVLSTARPSFAAINSDTSTTICAFYLTHRHIPTCPANMPLKAFQLLPIEVQTLSSPLFPLPSQTNRHLKRSTRISPSTWTPIEILPTSMPSAAKLAMQFSHIDAVPGVLDGHLSTTWLLGGMDIISKWSICIAECIFVVQGLKKGLGLRRGIALGF